MITVRLYGGMGNQMFQYAFARSLAIEKGVNFRLDKRYLENRTPRKNFVFRDYDLSIFNIKENFYKEHGSISGIQLKGSDVLVKSIQYLPVVKKYIKNVYIEPYFNYNPSYQEIGPDSYCIGYFQSYKYFENIQDIIINEFSFKQPIGVHCNDLKSKIINSNSVCINIRRADFVNNAHHGTVSELYYYHAINLLRNHEENMELFIFSDDIKWCEENLKFEHPAHFVSHEYAGSKFADYLNLMISCKHFIIPNSTFGWWAAYLSKNKSKKIIAPKKWFLNTDINISDLIPDNWLRI